MWLALLWLPSLPLCADQLADAATASLASELNPAAKVWIDIAMALLLTLPLALLAVVFVRLHKLQEHESHERQLLLQELAENERHFRFIAENSADVIWIFDIASQQMSYISPSVTHLLGYTPEEVTTKKVFAFVTDESANRLEEMLTQAIACWSAGDTQISKRILRIDHLHKDGHLVHVEVMTTLHANNEGKLVSILGVTRDLSERHANDEIMHHLAFYDSLTGLPNRRLLEDRMNQTIALAQRENNRFAILFVDLDKFKPINDTYGHAMGDWLLKEVAERMEATLRASDTVARIGGDEFVIVLPKVETSQAAMRIATKIHEQLETPFETDTGFQLQIACCIGVCLYPLHGSSPKQLLKHADQAMYQAKKSGGRRSCLFVSPPEDPVVHDETNPDFSLHLTWRESYASGNEIIDHEHQQLFAQTNALLRTLFNEKPDPALLHEQLNRLLQSVASHFASEEQILEELGYPDREAHRLKHLGLLQKAALLRDSTRRRELTPGELIDYVTREIILGHMLKEDRKFFPLLSPRNDKTNLHPRKA